MQWIQRWNVSTGVFRFARHHELARYLRDGWKFAGDLGPTHGQWSVLIWWCCGIGCNDESIPQLTRGINDEHDYRNSERR